MKNGATVVPRSLIGAKGEKGLADRCERSKGITGLNLSSRVPFNRVASKTGWLLVLKFKLDRLDLVWCGRR